MAPVTGKIPDRNQYQPVLLARLLQNLLAPHLPIDWILRMHG
jgi:hypothetical protein